MKIEPRPAALTLGDLLDEPALDLELLTGGPDARDRPVAGAQSVELESPGRWLDTGWVMLTAGVRLLGRPDAQRELVTELEAAKVTALGFAISSVFHAVPEPMLEEARARGFPVFRIPFETPARSIITFINRALLTVDEQSYRRLLSMQRYLTDALRDPQPEQTVIDRLASLVDAVVLLFSPGGALERASGDAPAAALWHELEGRRPALREFDAAGWHAVATPVASTEDAPARWLVIASPRSGFVNRLTKPVAEAAAPLLVAMARLGTIAHDQELAVRGALLEELLAVSDGPIPAGVVARAAALGVDFERPARIVAVGGVERRALERAAAEAGLPCLIAAPADGPITALVQDGPDAAVTPVLEALAAEAPDALAGIGRPAAAIDGVHDSWRDALLALGRLPTTAGERTLDFERFDLPTFLVSEARPERIRPKADAFLQPLLDHPALYEGVVAYLEHDLDIGAAAAALHLHPNSLRYRLLRVEKLYGVPIRQPAFLAAVYVALLVAPDP